MNKLKSLISRLKSQIKTLKPQNRVTTHQTLKKTGVTNHTGFRILTFFNLF